MRRILLALFSACAAIVLTAGRADAGFVLELTQSGFPTMSIADDDVNDMNPDPGQIGTVSDYGTFDVTVFSATSNKAYGEPPAQIDSASIVVTNTTNEIQTVTIQLLTDTGFTFPGGIGSTLTLLNNLAISDMGEGSSMTLTSYADNADGEFGMEIATPSVTLSSLGEAQSFVTFVRTSMSYSMSQVAVVTLGAGQSLNFSATTMAVPEPAVVALFGLALLSFAARRRRARHGRG